MQVSYAKHSIGNAPKVSKYKGLVKVRSKKFIAFPRIWENFPDQNFKFIPDRFEFNSIKRSLFEQTVRNPYLQQIIVSHLSP